MPKKKTKKIDWNGIINKLLNDESKVDDKINVAVNMSVTVNIGNYESLRYGIAASMDCKQEKADLVRKELENYIEGKLSKKYKEIKNSNNTIIEVNENVEERIIDDLLEDDNNQEDIEIEVL